MWVKAGKQQWLELPTVVTAWAPLRCCVIPSAQAAILGLATCFQAATLARAARLQAEASVRARGRGGQEHPLEYVPGASNCRVLALLS